VTKVLLSLGSNIEPRIGFITGALNALSEVMDIHRVSSMYETQPVGYTNQAQFINVAILGSTELSPEQLHARCKEIELRVGRVHRERWHEREIDIDVLLYGAAVVSADALEIPHPRMGERRFVLVPCCEIASHMIHPLTLLTLEQMLLGCTDTSDVQLYNALQTSQVHRS
jgi:2-amino-4-hydroxy-6-hydroxymethyldihydropteridine diphosphokinase